MMIAGSYFDIRRLGIPKVLLSMEAIVSLGIWLLFYQDCVLEKLLGVLVGIGIILISRFSEGCIGLADGILLCMTGILLGYRQNLEMMMYAILLAAVASIIIIVFRKANRKSRIPFYPFLFTGFMLLEWRVFYG